MSPQPPHRQHCPPKEERPHQSFPGAELSPSGLPPFLGCAEPLGCFLVVPGAESLSQRPRSLGPGGGRQVHRCHTELPFCQQISFLGGLALNEGVNWLIKHVVQEPRPCGGRARP